MSMQISGLDVSKLLGCTRFD